MIEQELMKNFINKPIAFIKNHPKLDIVFLATSIVAFLTITLFNVTNAAFWFDEAFSSYIIQFSFADIFHYTSTDVHPPLYYWLLKAWSELFGTGEFGLRSMSILFAVGAIVAAFFLVRRLFGRKVALVALLFLTLSPMLVRYADEARMYTMSAFIAVTATYALVRANESRQRRWWVVYGVLVALGMWTHYFTILVWLAHWAWRLWATYSKGTSFKLWWKKFFSKNWVIAHVVAVGLFLPWLPFMIKQLGIVQSGGFWIGPAGIDTPTNYVTNAFYYLEHGQTQSWLALILLAVVILIIALIPKVYKGFNKVDKSKFMLVSSLAWVPAILLFLASLPPLRPSFVERYLIPSLVFYVVFMAVVLVVGTKTWRPILRAIPILAIVGMMIFGITNVYKYGNYNKNTNFHIVTREAIKDIQKAGKPGQPIIATTPWIFYEAVPYSTEEFPVYFIDANTEYIYGSLDMLKQNDMHKIKDIDAFGKQNPIIWYLGQDETGDVAPYENTWKSLQTVSHFDSLTNKALYRATQYRISGE